MLYFSSALNITLFPVEDANGSTFCSIVESQRNDAVIPFCCVDDLYSCVLGTYFTHFFNVTSYLA